MGNPENLGHLFLPAKATPPDLRLIAAPLPRPDGITAQSISLSSEEQAVNAGLNPLTYRRDVASGGRRATADRRRRTRTHGNTGQISPTTTSTVARLQRCTSGDEVMTCSAAPSAVFLLEPLSANKRLHASHAFALLLFLFLTIIMPLFFPQESTSSSSFFLHSFLTFHLFPFFLFTLPLLVLFVLLPYVAPLLQSFCSLLVIPTLHLLFLLVFILHFLLTLHLFLFPFFYFFLSFTIHIIVLLLLLFLLPIIFLLLLGLPPPFLLFTRHLASLHHLYFCSSSSIPSSLPPPFSIPPHQPLSPSPTPLLHFLHPSHHFPFTIALRPHPPLLPPLPSSLPSYRSSSLSSWPSAHCRPSRALGLDDTFAFHKSICESQQMRRTNL